MAFFFVPSTYIVDLLDNSEAGVPPTLNSVLTEF